MFMFVMRLKHVTIIDHIINLGARPMVDHSDWSTLSL